MAPQPKQYSAEELESLKSILTEEELEGMLDEDLLDDPEAGDTADNDSPFADEPDDDNAADAADGDAGDDDDGDAKGDDPGDDGDDDAADPAVADPDNGPKPDADSGAADPAPAADVDDDGDFPEIPEPPSFVAKEPPAELKTRAGELERSLEELAEKHDEGEITTAEFTKESRKIQRELAPLDVKLASATVSVEDADNQAKEHWSTQTVPAFLEHFPEYKQSRRMLKVLDDVVREVQVDEATNNPLHPDVLRKAHRIIEKEYGFTFAKAAKAAAADDPKPAANGKRTAPGKDKERQIPPTLGRVPAADHSDSVDTSKWAAIDRLKGVAYEDAMAKLSDEDSDAYEAWLAAK